MKKKTRLTILISCVACFLIASPILIAYSMGYRFDFENKKVVATGGIYVRTFPAANEISIDLGGSQKPGMFSNSVFVQSLLPKEHTVSIKKEGYFDYFKTLPVRENEVTKLESVLLIKKNILFESISDRADYFSFSPNGQNIILADNSSPNPSFEYISTNNPQTSKPSPILQTGKISNIKWADDSSKALIQIKKSSEVFYYLFNPSLQTAKTTKLSSLDKNSTQIIFNPQNSNQIFYIKNNILYALLADKPKSLIKNIATYQIIDNKFLWLGLDSMLYRSDLAGSLIEELNLETPLLGSPKNYEIISVSGKTFVKNNAVLNLLNLETKTLEKFTTPETDYKIINSPDNKNLIYWNSEKIYLYSFLEKQYQQIYSGAKITDCFWLNNDYLVFNSGDKVLISEIDYRGNINAYTLPGQIIISTDKSYKIESPQIFYERQSNKLYILTQGALLVSEKITP